MTFSDNQFQAIWLSQTDIRRRIEHNSIHPVTMADSARRTLET